IYSGPAWSNNVKIVADVDCRETHDDKDAYISIFYRYMDSANYYEARLVQGGDNNLIPYIYKTVSGVTTEGNLGNTDRHKTGTTLDNLTTVTVQVTTNNKHTVWVGNTWVVNNWTDASVPGPGTLGFSTMDASARVESVTVMTNNVVEYQEFFTGATATNWTTGGNGWVINQAADTYERVGRIGGLQIQVGTLPKLDPNNVFALDVAADITDITSLDYATANVIIHMAEERYLAIAHRDGAGSVRLDDVSVSGWRAFTNSYGTTAADSWIGGDTRVTTDRSSSSPHGLEMRASRAIDIPGESQFLRTPEITSAGSFAMRYYIPSGSPDVTLITSYSDDLNRTDFHAFSTNVLTAKGVWRTWPLPVNMDLSPRKLHLRVTHASPDPAARFYIDEVYVSDYHVENTNAWITYNGLLTANTDELTDNSDDLTYTGGNGRSGFLNYSTTDDVNGVVPLDEDDPYIRSPYMPLGIGEISFWYQRWPVASSAGQSVPLTIEISPDATEHSWQLLLSTNLTSTRWERMVLPYYNSSNHFVRVSNVLDPTPPDRLGIDRLMIKAPLATDLTITNISITPPIPLNTDSVRVRAELTDYILSPTVTQVRAYYHVGTAPWGTWSENEYLTLNLDMGASDTNANPPVYVYESSAGIPAQAIDETVQYRVKAEYSGALLPNKTSPKIHTAPGPNPTWYEPVNYNQSLGGPDAQNPYYVVFSCPTGAVWINEVNIHTNTWPWGAAEYIEVCGRAAADMRDWRLNIVNVDYSIHSTYLIVSNTVFADEEGGFGFWLLGDAGLPADQFFTNAPDPTYSMNLPSQGGIQLVRSFGGVQHAVSYGTVLGYSAAESMTGYEFIGQDLYYSASPITLLGSGSNYSQFAWVTTGGAFTPGAANSDQTLLGNPVPPVFELLIEELELGTDIVLWATLTNGTTPYVMYSTNLLDTNAWDDVTNESWDVSNGSFRIWFPVMTNSPAYFYRVTVTN
ncbi:MAG: hypothetical protein HN919_20805, partial [Verrucomicrobia bacterium]|nr:hypothetical protein [Verrucomicrobiota bacterium]